jgi:hypothetical protein
MRQVSSQPQQEPPHVLRAAAAYQLGPLQRIYEPGREAYLYRVVSLFSMIVGCLILLFFFLAYDSLFSGWQLWQAVLVPLIGVIWLLLAAWIFLTPYIYPRLRIFVYRNGLIYAKGKAEVLRWDQMERVWKDLEVERKGSLSVRAYTVRRSDDTLFVFTGELKDVETLGRLIEAEITRRLLPRALAAYHAGGPVVFDEVVVSGYGIGVRPGRKLLLWDEFDRISVDETKLALYKKGMKAAWVVIKIANIPNVGILKELIPHVEREIRLKHIPCVLAYNAGRIQTFGALYVSKQGITVNHGKWLLPWNEIASVGVGEHEVMIRRESRQPEWYTIPLWQVSDAAELKALMDYIMREKS